jgi:excisionase family DNA binding protein
VVEDRDATQDRVTIQEAARRLGVKEDAVRKRIQRGSIRHEKAEDGRVYVWVDTTQDTRQTSQDTTQDATQDATQDERLEDLKDQVGYLRRQLDEEREARRRADTIIAQLARANEEQARTIRELEAPQEATKVTETVEEAPDRAEEPWAEEPWAAAGGAQESAQRPQERSWWRRVFGG